ncbi:MAG: HAD-IIIA family hydrolase [Candidatus Yanofskybacteria bacterium]|nr:HAD-IIIA family hydrolase [Candidatus Yanofskybacteria bacterium]
MTKCIFLDRDGVLVKSVLRNGQLDAPFNLAEFEIVKDAPDAVTNFKKLGYLCIVISNQPGISLGQISQTEVELMNQKLLAQLLLDDIYICPHSHLENCECQKPKIGLFLKAIQRWEIDPKISFMIGDRDTDIQAAKKVGCRSILITGGDDSGLTEPDFYATSLTEAVLVVAQNS